MSEWWGALPADRSRPSRLCLMVLTERTSSVHSTHERLLAITGGEGFASSMVVVISLCTHILNHCVGHFYRNHSIQPKKKKRWGSQSYQGGSGSCTKGWDHPTASPSTPPSPNSHAPKASVTWGPGYLGPAWHCLASRGLRLLPGATAGGGGLPC